MTDDPTALDREILDTAAGKPFSALTMEEVDAELRWLVAQSNLGSQTRLRVDALLDRRLELRDRSFARRKLARL